MTNSRSNTLNMLIGYYETLQDHMKTDLAVMSKQFEEIYGTEYGKHFYESQEHLKISIDEMQKAINGLYAELDKIEEY
jgi:hypothetical protein